MEDKQLGELLKRVSQVAEYFAKSGPQGGGSGGGGGRQAPQKQAPSGETRECKHGEMTYRSGVSKAGNAYKGFFCPERDRSEQCKPVFLK